jgi:uncharacterized membrane protein
MEWKRYGSHKRGGRRLGGAERNENVTVLLTPTVGHVWCDLKQCINEVLYYYLDVAGLIAGVIFGAIIVIIAAVVIAIIVMFICKSLAYHKSSNYFCVHA